MKILWITLAASFLGCSQIWASGCTEMAAFKTEINEFLKTGSISESLRADVQQLASKCEFMHEKGNLVKSIASCNDALELTRVN